MVYLKPVLPVTCRNAEFFLGGAELDWTDAQNVPDELRIRKFKPLMQRVDGDKVRQMIEASKEQDAAGDENAEAAGGIFEPEISIEEFARIDLRVARIQDAHHVEGADKLIRLVLDVGSEVRQVFAGIKQAYEPETLIGRQVVMVANLAPRKMQFGVSQGMVLGAGPGGKDIFLLEPDTGAVPGMRVK